jgi:hypothetical protein
MATKVAPMQKEAVCKCGIPNCPGHKIVDGKALITRHPHFDKKAAE